MTVLKSALNDSLGEQCLSLVEDGNYKAVYEIIRAQTNPLTAAWLALFVVDNLPEHQKQFKNWLANVTYNGV